MGCDVMIPTSTIWTNGESIYDPETEILTGLDGSTQKLDASNVAKFGWWYPVGEEPEEFSIQFGREIHDPRTGKLLGSRRGSSSEDVNPDSTVHLNASSGERATVTFPEERLGRCYELAGRYASQNPNSELVHGTIQGAGNPPLDHAWVNLPTGDVYEPISDQEWDKVAFDAFFNPVEKVTYDHMNTLDKMIDTEHWGPWDD